MVNPFDYLYYKIYSALSYISGGGNPINHIGAMGLLLTSNFLTFYLLVYEGFPSNIRSQLSYDGLSPDLLIFGSGIFVILFVYPFFYGAKRTEKIIMKYKNESEQSRMIGNAAVVLYVIVSIVAFALVLKAYVAPVQPDTIHQVPVHPLRDTVKGV